MFRRWINNIFYVLDEITSQLYALILYYLFLSSKNFVFTSQNKFFNKKKNQIAENG